MKAGRKRELVRSFLKRILSITMSKIRISRAQKQIYLHFAEANKAKIQDKPKRRQIHSHFAGAKGPRTWIANNPEFRSAAGKTGTTTNRPGSSCRKSGHKIIYAPEAQKGCGKRFFSYLCPVIFVSGRTAPGKTRLRFTSSPHASRHEANRTNGRYSRLPQSSENIC